MKDSAPLALLKSLSSNAAGICFSILTRTVARIRVRVRVIGMRMGMVRNIIALHAPIPGEWCINEVDELPDVGKGIAHAQGRAHTGTQRDTHTQGRSVTHAHRKQSNLTLLLLSVRRARAHTHRKQRNLTRLRLFCTACKGAHKQGRQSTWTVNSPSASSSCRFFCSACRLRKRAASRMGVSLISSRSMRSFGTGATPLVATPLAATPAVTILYCITLYEVLRYGCLRVIILLAFPGPR